MHIKKTVNLPKELLDEAVRLSGATTQTMAIVLALEELIKRKKIERMQQLKGKGKVTFKAGFLTKSRGR